MSKHIVLTVDEYKDYQINSRIIFYINEFLKNHELLKDNINILEWGCGKGKDVLKLREMGYNAYGVDIDVEPINNGRKLFIKMGYDPNLISEISKEGRTIFNNGQFHFIFSNQVFEHIKDLEIVAKEMSRITASFGEALHLYPAPYYIKEGHLFMPFVHWFPKNLIRKLIIAFYVIVGVEPKWSKYENIKLTDKIDGYYQYSINKTFYRNHKVIENIFNKYGFDVNYKTIDNPRVLRKKISSIMVKNKYLRSFFNFLLLTFYNHELYLKKSSNKRLLFP